MYLNIFIVVIIFTIIGITEIVPIKKNKTRKEFTVYILFFTTAFILMFLYGAGIEIPKISKGLDIIIESII